MKRIVIVAFIVSVFSANAQINKINIEDHKAVVIQRYDSLQSICNENYKQHIGQIIYLKESELAKESGGYSNFYTKASFDSPIFREHYASIASKKHSNLEVSDYNIMKESYFIVDSIIMSPRETVFREGYLKLIKKDTQDVLFYRFNDGSSSMFSDFISVGYFEKIKQNWKGRNFIYTGGNNSKGLLDYSNKKEYVKIADGSVLQCKDITLVDGDNTYIYAILSNNNETLIQPIYTNMKGGSLSYGDLIREDEYNKESKEKEESKLALIKKYGISNAKKILEGIVVTGWTKQMCLESWGEPKDINTTSGSFGVHEQWVYDYNRYLYFENGKLTTIQN